MMNFTTDPTIIKTELWFLPIDIIMVITTALTLILGLIFLITACTHKHCWSVSMLLICNSCLAKVLVSSFFFSMSIFTFQNDLKQNTGNISFCNIIGYFLYTADTLQNYSYLLTAMYQYTSVVYPGRILWQSVRFQVYLITGQWIFSFVFALPLLLTGQIIYNIDNQTCQVPLRLSVSMIYIPVVLYIVPTSGILCIYIKLTRYVRQISVQTTAAHTLFHARRELRLVQRTFILISILITLGIPYMMFVLWSFFTNPPTYHFRIAYIFIALGLLIIMLTLFHFTPQIKTIIQNVFSRANAVEPMGGTTRA